MIDSEGGHVSDESLGIRVFEVSKQRAVERCIQRWRNGLKADWSLLSHDDINNLRWIAGEIWANRSRDDWDSMHFSKIDLRETRIVVSHADRLRRHGVNRAATIEMVVALVHNARETHDAVAGASEESLSC